MTADRDLYFLRAERLRGRAGPPPVHQVSLVSIIRMFEPDAIDALADGRWARSRQGQLYKLQSGLFQPPLPGFERVEAG